MGIYLNSSAACTLYRSDAAKPYFIDKSMLLEELMPLAEQGGHYICITRPRRFGKTMAANMIAAFFSKGADSRSLFDSLNIGKSDLYPAHLNQHNVIHISFNKLPRKCRDYTQYIERIEHQLTEDLMEVYPDIPVRDTDAIWDILMKVHTGSRGERFIFVLDEWDFIFHRDFITQQNKEDYIDFLSSLLKDQPYVELAYMTGILPIAKYSSGSELNMFLEYTMTAREKYSEYFGFTEAEVDLLYERYLRFHPSPAISREGLTRWYDGYQTISGKKLYNPRSVVAALSDGQLGSYWTSSGPYDEIFYYIERDIDQVRNDLALMISGTPVPANIQEYAATSMELTTRDEIFSAMVVYGFLTYKDGCVSIPNKELMDKFADMIRKHLPSS